MTLLTKIRQWFWLTGLLVVLAWGTIFAPAAAAQDLSGTILTVVAPVLNVRSGPGVTYPTFTSLTAGDTLPVVGHDAASGWWQVQLLNGQTGWVSGGSSYVSITPGLSAGPALNPEQTASASLQSPTSTLGVQPSTSSSLSGTLVFQTSSGGSIYAINADGSNLHLLTHGMDPALSPDGQWVAFTRWNTSQDGALGNLWLIKVDGTGEHVIMDNVFNPRAPVWSPDGSRIVISMQYGGRPDYEHQCGFRSPPRGAVDVETKKRSGGKIEYCYTLLPDPHWSLRQINVATGQYENLLSDTYSRSPAWDPRNSQRLVYPGQNGLVNLDLANNQPSALTDDLNEHDPVFSPDGSRLAVTYRQDDHWEVHVLNADGGGQIRLTQTSYEVLMQQELKGETPHSWDNASPAWSPDGSQIAFVTNRTGQWEIWVMNADGSNQRPMFSPQTLAGITLQYQSLDERMLSWR